MTAELIDGKAIAQALRRRIAERVRVLQERGVVPTLAVILVGEDPASHVYVRNKVTACAEVGIRSRKYEFPADVSAERLLACIDALNADSEVDGILVQLPLPPHIDETLVLERIAVSKDVDGFHAENVGRLVQGRECFWPCTPHGVMQLLAWEGIEPQGMDAVVVGRSNIVGKPMALMLLNAGATVTVAHSRTRELAAHTRRADLLVVAVGKPEFITPEMVKPGAVVIDVGINRLPDGRLVGDVATGVREVASRITPVPGGVGPMTIAMLLENTLLAAQRRRGIAP
ncbi:bifunctional methylenetetrahydrofolate dehydrogenase/methenyltetrahydrofolate cyclohydrolase FolD [Tepidiphilus margaritifer]|uniref:bifunctional methylenetetrahydrofolate dehydrogenase/methenyltetrahydrofolate cyclohydrolase FolD n=1 Tax=Tepidiphilus margaritifer TaxID=203471 RepID=UPI0004165355|nr:bifunctional methylenetetrahydrofolate dehydrogenase/methenyltetrahydrofolate cyclohydrolase FolD [Tepidiphilus margaritifer]